MRSDDDDILSHHRCAFDLPVVLVFGNQPRGPHQNSRSQLEAMHLSIVALDLPATQSWFMRLLSSVFIHKSSLWLWGYVQGHHPHPPYHNIIFHRHLINHLHPPSYHSSPPFHVFISRIILQLHFHASFISSIIFHHHRPIHHIIKKIPHHSSFTIISSSLNIAPRPLIEFRLVKNIDTLIS